VSQPSSASIAALWRYPIKSMMGEEINATQITKEGVLGDRAYALVDNETDKVVSAKNPKKWPDFFRFRAAYTAPPKAGSVPAAWITLPDGELIRSDQADVNDILSKAVSRAVTLRNKAPEASSLEQYWPEYDGEDREVTSEGISGDAPAGSFFDYATLHILTTSSIDQLRGLYPAGRFEARRFRPNIVVNTEGQQGFVENDWVGKTLRVGDSVRLLVTDPCPRCVMTTLPQGDLPKDPGIFRKAIAKNNVFVPFANKALPSAGVYAKVLSPGTIRRGDPVSIE